MFVPKLSAPLTKAIRTTEGVVLGGLAVLSQVASYVDPSTLSHAEALKYSTISAGILAVQRGAIKVVALIKADTWISPAPVDETDVVEHFAGQVAAQLHLPATVLDDASLAKIAAAVAEIVGHPGSALQTVETQVVSDAEEFASQPPPAPVVRPESAVTPDAPVVAVPAAAPVQATPAVPAPPAVTQGA